MFSCFVLDKCTVSWLQVSEPDEERESVRRQGYLRWVRIGAVYVYEDCVTKSFRDADVNNMII